MQRARLPSIIRNVGGGALGVGPDCCGVPPEAPRSVTAARVCIALSIVFHAISLFAKGWFSELQRNTAFGVFAMGVLVLYVYDQYMYAIGGTAFAVCALFDIVAVLRWITGDDGATAFWYALPPFLGAMTTGLGAIFSFTAVFFWKDVDDTAGLYPQIRQGSRTAELGLAPPAAHPRTPPPAYAYHPQSPPPAYR